MAAKMADVQLKFANSGSSGPRRSNLGSVNSSRAQLLQSPTRLNVSGFARQIFQFNPQKALNPRLLLITWSDFCSENGFSFAQPRHRFLNIQIVFSLTISVTTCFWLSGFRGLKNRNTNNKNLQFTVTYLLISINNITYLFQFCFMFFLDFC